MLEYIRSHKRLMQILLGLFIVPGLGFAGIEGFKGFFDTSGYVAEVNGHKIPRQEYDAARRDQQDRMRQMMGEQYDPKALDTPAMRRALLDNLVQQRIVAERTANLNLTVSDAAVRHAILAIPAIAQLRKADGSIDVEGYKQMLAAQGMTPEQLDQRVRFSLASEQIQQNLQSSAFVPKSIVARLTALSGQQREVQALTFKPSAFAAQVHPTEAQIDAYYAAHKAAYQTPESAAIQYVALDQATLATAIQPTDTEIRQYYDTHLAQFKTPPEIRASHILISVPAKASVAERAQDKAKAEALLAQVRAHPDRFAELAKQVSQDPGSAEKGGDLGFFGHGMMLKPFEDAAFALKPGQISDLVKTDFGYHIIKVTDVKPATTKPFDEVKAELALTLKNQRAAQRFADDQTTFTKLVDEQSDSLQPVADKLKLPVKTATVSLTPGAGQAGVLKNPKLLKAIFSDDTLKNHYNTQPVDVGSGMLVAARVTQYTPAVTPPLSAVKAKVTAEVVAVEAAGLARKAGEAKLGELRKTKSTAGLQPPMTVSRENTQHLDAASLRPIFKADEHALPQYVGADLGAEGYAIYRVNSVKPGKPLGAQELKSASDELAKMVGQADLEAYFAHLRDEAKVKVYGNLEQPAE